MKVYVDAMQQEVEYPDSWTPEQISEHYKSTLLPMWQQSQATSQQKKQDFDKLHALDSSIEAEENQAVLDKMPKIQDPEAKGFFKTLEEHGFFYPDGSFRSQGFQENLQQGGLGAAAVKFQNFAFGENLDKESGFTNPRRTLKEEADGFFAKYGTGVIVDLYEEYESLDPLDPEYGEKRKEVWDRLQHAKMLATATGNTYAERGTDKLLDDIQQVRESGAEFLEDPGGVLAGMKDAFLADPGAFIAELVVDLNRDPLLFAVPLGAKGAIKGVQARRVSRLRKSPGALEEVAKRQGRAAEHLAKGMAVTVPTANEVFEEMARLGVAGRAGVGAAGAAATAIGTVAPLEAIRQYSNRGEIDGMALLGTTGMVGTFAAVLGAATGAWSFALSRAASRIGVDKATLDKIAEDVLESRPVDPKTGLPKEMTLKELAEQVMHRAEAKFAKVEAEAIVNDMEKAPNRATRARTEPTPDSPMPVERTSPTVTKNIGEGTPERRFTTSAGERFDDPSRPPKEVPLSRPDKAPTLRQIQQNELKGVPLQEELFPEQSAYTRAELTPRPGKGRGYARKNDAMRDLATSEKKGTLYTGDIPLSKVRVERLRQVVKAVLDQGEDVWLEDEIVKATGVDRLMAQARKSGDPELEAAARMLSEGSDADVAYLSRNADRQVTMKVAEETAVRTTPLQRAKLAVEQIGMRGDKPHFKLRNPESGFISVADATKLAAGGIAALSVYSYASKENADSDTLVLGLAAAVGILMGPTVARSTARLLDNIRTNRSNKLKQTIRDTMKRLGEDRKPLDEAERLQILKEKLTSWKEQGAMGQLDGAFVHRQVLEMPGMESLAARFALGEIIFRLPRNQWAKNLSPEMLKNAQELADGLNTMRAQAIDADLEHTWLQATARMLIDPTNRDLTLIVRALRGTNDVLEGFRAIDDDKYLASLVRHRIDPAVLMAKMTEAYHVALATRNFVDAITAQSVWGGQRIAYKPADFRKAEKAVKDHDKKVMAGARGLFDEPEYVRYIEEARADIHMYTQNHNFPALKGLYIHPEAMGAIRFMFEAPDLSRFMQGALRATMWVKRTKVGASLFHAKVLLESAMYANDKQTTAKMAAAYAAAYGLGAAGGFAATGVFGDDIRKSTRALLANGVGAVAGMVALSKMNRRTRERWLTALHANSQVQPAALMHAQLDHGLVQDGVRYGLGLGLIEDLKSEQFYADLQAFGGLLDKVAPFEAGSAFTKQVEVLQRKIDMYMWDNVHTGNKLATYAAKVEELTNKWGDKLSHEEIGRIAAQYTNDAYGGLDFATLGLQMYQNGKFKNFLSKAFTPKGRKLMQFWLFAPDWTISNLRILYKGMGWGGDDVAKATRALHRGYAMRGALAVGMMGFIQDAILKSGGDPSRVPEALAERWDQIWDAWDPKDDSYNEWQRAANHVYHRMSTVDIGDGRKIHYNKQILEVPKIMLDPGKYVAGKLAWIPQKVAEIVANKQYFTSGHGPFLPVPLEGPPIIDPKTQSYSEMAVRLGGKLAKDTLLPIAITSSMDPMLSPHAPGMADRIAGAVGSAVGGAAGQPAFGESKKKDTPPKRGASRAIRQTSGERRGASRAIR